MKAIVFSSYIPDKASLLVGIEFLNVFRDLFSDYDIFIGINDGSISERVDTIKQYTDMNIKFGIVDKNLVVDSDVSGFQKALQLMKEEHKEYELVRFGHTKGATTNRDYIRKDIIDKFFYQKRRIENIFNDKNIGIFGTYITTTTNLKSIDHNLNKLSNNWKYNSANIFYLYTFYVIRGNIIYDFLNTCNDGFFTKNLVKYYKFDRYFFESDFPNIPSRYGYKQAYDVITHHPIRNINSKFKIDILFDYRFNKSFLNTAIIFLFTITNKILFFLYSIFDKIFAISFINKYKNKIIKLFYKI